MKDLVHCRTLRRIGVELELNTSSGEVVPLNGVEIPEGSSYIANLVTKITKKSTQVDGWHRTDNNNVWIVKPDRSCGIEVCTPVLKGWYGLKHLLHVIKAFGQDPIVSSDHRCSFHVHVNTADLNEDQIGSVLAYWIKCEHLVYDAFPTRRKISRWCQFLGMTDMFDSSESYSADDLIDAVSRAKYYSVNVYHYARNRRDTIEYRIAENDFCLDPFEAKQYIRFLLHFTEVAATYPIPKTLCWLTPRQIADFLMFDAAHSDRLSPGLTHVKKWFWGRVSHFMNDGDTPDVWSSKARSRAFQQVKDIMEEQGLPMGLYRPDNLEEITFFQDL